MMKIKMPVKFHGNYRVTIRQGEWETRERCQKLVVRELTPSEKEQYYKQMDEKDVPTHQVSFFDFGCRRIIEGKLAVNEEDRVAFAVEEKEYEFAPFRVEK
ncbi:MAG: hypothetical protein ACXWL9_06525 [Syntrophales bacterium]